MPSYLNKVSIIKNLPDNITVTVITGNYYDEQMPSYLNKTSIHSKTCKISVVYSYSQFIENIGIFLFSLRCLSLLKALHILFQA